MGNFRGWILDAIPRESAAAVGKRIIITYLPVGRRYLYTLGSFRSYFFPRVGVENFFIHHRSFIFVSTKRDIQKSRNRIWVTHFDEVSDIDYLLDQRFYIDKLFVQNLNLANLLFRAGFSAEQISVQPGAIDRADYYPLSERNVKNSYFVFTGDCKKRKNPEFVEWLILNFPEYNFLIHGDGWDVYKGGSLLKIPNLRIVKFDLQNQGEILRNADALLVLSTLEGGPISILESLASGTPVASSNVGFASEILTSERGLIVQLDESIDYWSEVLRFMKEFKKSTWSKDLLEGSYSWEDLGNEFYF